MSKVIYYTTWLLVGIAGYAFMSNAQAAEWNVQAGKYYKWDTTPLNLTDSAFKYLLTTEIEAVRPHWTKVKGTWIKYTTVTNGLKYAEEVIIAQPPAPTCQAFVCRDDFGWTFNMAKNTVLTCPMVKITNGQAQVYDGLQSINGEPRCQ